MAVGRQQHVAQAVQEYMREQQRRRVVEEQGRRMSKGFMKAAISCQMCSVVVSDTGSVVVCDNCELGYHSKCLQSYDAGGGMGESGEWVCPRCVVLRRGRPVAPRYGPLRAAAAVGGTEDATVESVVDEREEGMSMSGARQEEQVGRPDPDLCQWVGEMVQVVEGRAYYGKCKVGEHVYQVGECALLRPCSDDLPPYIARLHSLWEDTCLGTKWVGVHWCYHPRDIPNHLSLPSLPQADEVYLSNHSDDNPVGSILGPCQVFSPSGFMQERRRLLDVLRRDPLKMPKPQPMFLCRWLYDAPNGTFGACQENHMGPDSAGWNKRKEGDVLFLE